MPKKKIRRYGDYICVINGQDYAVVRLPLGGGKYKKKVKLLSKIGGTKSEAAKWAWNELEKHKSGSFNRSEAIYWTFEDAARWYKREFLIPPVFEHGIKVEGVKDYQKQKSKLDRMSERFGAKPITSFTDEDLRRYIRHRREIDKVKTATINRDFALLKTMFKRLAKQIGKHFEIPDFPINSQAENERDRVMTFQEETKILSVCVAVETITVKRKGKSITMEIDAKREHLKPIIITAVDTAMRQGELMKLAWSDIDFQTDTVTIQSFNSKTQKTRKVGMTPRVKNELLKLRVSSGNSATVFGIKSPQKAFKTSCERAGIKDLVFHDLRHTATTRMIRAGIPSAEVMKITGHTQVKTFMRYLNLVNETVQSNANQLALYLNNYEVIESDSIGN